MRSTELRTLILDALAERGWTVAELARRTDVSPSTLYSWVKGARAGGNRGPNKMALTAVAEALNISRATIFRAAGHFVPTPPDERTVRLVIDVLEPMTPDEQVEAVTMLQAYAEAKRRGREGE